MHTHLCAHILFPQITGGWCPYRGHAFLYICSASCTFGSVGGGSEEHCTFCGHFLPTCHQGRLPDLFHGYRPHLPDTFIMGLSPLDCTHGYRSVPTQGSFTSCWNHMADIVWPSENPRLGLATQTLSSVNAIVSSAHSVLLGIALTPRRYIPFRGLTDAEQAFLQQDPEKRPSGQGSFKEAVLCEGKRKNKELLNGPGVVNEERTRGGWALRATYLDWKIFKV